MVTEDGKIQSFVVNKTCSVVLVLILILKFDTVQYSTAQYCTVLSIKPLLMTRLSELRNINKNNSCPTIAIAIFIRSGDEFFMYGQR